MAVPDSVLAEYQFFSEENQREFDWDAWVADKLPLKVQERLQNIEKVGEGGYGEVFKAKDLVTQRIVAAKKLRRNHEKEGFPITSIREIKLLRELRHRNIVPIESIYTSSETDNVYVLFEYMEHDLDGLIAKYELSVPQIKCYFRQLLEALEYLHHKGVLHRDLKPSNVLVNNRGILKLCDFGFARKVKTGQHEARYTPVVVTMWYRAPEILLGCDSYTEAIDLWAAGCILYEMLNRGKVLFRTNGNTDLDQLDRIFYMCGTPTEVECPSLRKWQGWSTMRPNTKHPRNLNDRIAKWTLEARELLDGLLQYEPGRRTCAEKALQHLWFLVPPYPESPERILQYPEQHKWTIRQQRRGEVEVGAHAPRPSEPPAPSAAPGSVKTTEKDKEKPPEAKPVLTAAAATARTVAKPQPTAAKPDPPATAATAAPRPAGATTESSAPAEAQTPAQAQAQQPEQQAPKRGRGSALIFQAMRSMTDSAAKRQRQDPLK
eukprot:TRINITY_DN9603_c0_g1_i1.p1 TRINITY_DN9603_c0_g1~~TRINITY_DN9603_c0_g1_i1.p1  ORF type:complete len:507 (+),score=116.14 TRINITY_DN9603_c0_g1_i1:52-1521(+)